MISIDNTRKPFIRNKSGFRRSGVKNYQVPSTDFNLEGSGSGDAGQDIWKPAMQKYLDGIPRTGFKNPPAKIERGKMIDVPRVFGLGIRAATKKFEQEGFTVISSYVYSESPEGTFLGYSPRPGGRAPQYSTIFVRYRRAAIQCDRRRAGGSSEEAEARARADARAERAEPAEPDARPRPEGGESAKRKAAEEAEESKALSPIRA